MIADTTAANNTEYKNKEIQTLLVAHLQQPDVW